MKPFRLAILECDTPIDDVLSKRGTYGDIFTSLIEKALLAKNLSSDTLAITSWDVVHKQEYPKLSDIDGILLSGSKHDSFASNPWILKLVSFVQEIFSAHKPIVGICFGHQILARAMGAPVGRSTEGWEVSVDRVILNEVGTKLFPGKHEITIHQMHRDIVQSVPHGFQNVGSSPRCKVQGLYLPGRVLSVQGHPEFDTYIMESLLEKRHNDGIFDDTVYNDGMQRARLGDDGVEIAGVALNLFLSDVQP